MDVVGLALAGGIALGLGLLAAWGMLSLGDLVDRLRQFYRPPWRQTLAAYFGSEATEIEAREEVRGRGGLLSFLPGLGGLLLAVVVRDGLLSPYLMILGLALSWFLRVRQGRKEQAAITGQVKALVLLFRSRFAVGESPFSVLASIEGELPSGQVRNAVQRAADVYHASGSGERALAPLRELNNSYLTRLAMVLEASPSSSSEVVMDELKRLEGDLKARDRLRGRARASLALLKGTTRFLQAANLTAMVAAVALPLYRDFYTSTLQRRGTFLAATLFLALASLYFDQEIALQEEKVL